MRSHSHSPAHLSIHLCWSSSCRFSVQTCGEHEAVLGGEGDPRSREKLRQDSHGLGMGPGGPSRGTHALNCLAWQGPQDAAS